MNSNTKRHLIDAIRRAQAQWTHADWTHERRENGKVCYESDPHDPDARTPEYCAGDNDAQCEVCRDARSDASAARDLGNEAIKAIEAGDLQTARTRLYEARDIEDQWGDAPAWNPVVRSMQEIG